MHLLDISVRLIAITAILLLAFLALHGMRQVIQARYLIIMLIGVAGHVMTNSPLNTPWWPPLFYVADFLSKILVILIWWFCLSIFDDDFRLKWRIFTVGALWLVLVLMSNPYKLIANPVASETRLIIAFLISIHLFHRIITGAKTDLVEKRRRIRAGFVITSAAMILIDVSIDALYSPLLDTFTFSISQNIVTIIITLATCLWLVHFNAAHLLFENSQIKETTRPDALSGTTKHLHQKLLKLIDEGIYLQPEMSVSKMAGSMNIPEHQLRALINQTMGYRNFRTFLNSYRLAFAKATLADTATLNTPIHTIALDSGFASLASFNRVFKNEVGQTPTAFRRSSINQ